MNQAYIGRKPANDDILPVGSWIKHPHTGVVHYVNHKYHVNRLLMEGGQIVPEPPREAVVQLPSQEEMLRMEVERLRAELKAAQETSNASEINDGATNQSREAHDPRQPANRRR
jgi:hypothetical protein